CYLYVRRFICRGYKAVLKGTNLRGRGRALQMRRSRICLRFAQQSEGQNAQRSDQGSPAGEAAKENSFGIFSPMQPSC
ncbi:MAG: hypothetical protein IIW84_04900, partial [Selenomonadaceae bacterium]|nr:hypothetical protein [Selenomonadaceae bacterium]